MDEGGRLSVAREREFYQLWLVATAAYGIGDTLTTLILIGAVPHVTEGNAVVAWIVAAFGGPGLAALKITVLAFCVLVSASADSARDRLLYYGPPAFLAVVGSFATVYNLRLMLG